MPPRVRLTDDERERLPALLAAAALRADDFPAEAPPETQVAWLWRTYAAEEPLSVPLLTLLLFEHGPHRSADTVAQLLAAARADGLLHDR